MPSAPPELQAMFEDDFEASLVVEKRHFFNQYGYIIPKHDKESLPKPDREDEAIDYLILEWDYGYEGSN